MRLFTFSLIILCVFSVTNLLDRLSAPSSPAHQFCLQRVPTDLQFTSLLRSLVCGAPIEDPNLKNLFIDTSLIHLIVVSGSHFLILLMILRFFTQRIWIHFTILIAYFFVTRAQAPAMMALLLWALRQKKSAELKSHQIVLLAGLGCLLIRPTWIHSQSLYLSWLCCLALAMSTSFEKEEIPHPAQLIKTQLMIYLLINIFGGWNTWAHPLGILINLTIGNLLSLFLFPWGAFIVLSQQSGSIFDFVTAQTLWVLRACGPPARLDLQWIWTEWWWLWILCFQILLDLRFRFRGHH